jgi:hypothetical protein
MTIDRQKAAFIEATESDWTRQTELLQGTVVHEPDDPDAEPIREPEEWHAQGWDAECEPPKTITQAREALAARIALETPQRTRQRRFRMDQIPPNVTT